MKTITGEIFFQIWAQDNNTFWMILKKFRQNWLVKKSKIVWRKKPTQAQMFRYFCYKSRNNNTLLDANCITLCFIKYVFKNIIWFFFFFKNFYLQIKFL